MSFPSKQPAFYHVFHAWGEGGEGGGEGAAAKSRYRCFPFYWLFVVILLVFGFWFLVLRTQSGSALLVPRHIPVGFNDCYWNSEQRSSLWTANVVSGHLKQSHEILVSASSLCNYFSAPRSLLQTCRFNYLSIMRPVRQTQRINLDIEIAH